MRLTEKKKKKVFVPGDEDGAWIEIMYLKPGLRNRIDTISNDISASGVGEETVETKIAFNQLKKRELFFKYAILSWGGFLDRRGKETSPTKKTIDLFDKEIGNLELPDGSKGGLYEWLQAEMDIFVEEVEDQEDEEKEN